MAEIKDIVKLAVDGYKGKVEKYSVGQSQELLRQALVEANGGSTVLDYKKIRDGKCTGLFSLLEETLSRTVVEGLQGDEYFNALVDFRNVPEGDKNIFLVEDRNLFVVSEAADGTQGIRRQRLGGVSEASIIAGDDKPIKVVYEGSPIVLMGDPMNNADFTQEYLYGEKYGMGIVLAGGNAGVGRYEMNA